MRETNLDSASGFALHEVVVALAILAVALMGLAATLTSAIEHLGAARSRELAAAAAAAVAASSARDAVYPAAPSRAGEPGLDGLPGTADDVAVAPAPCVRHVEALSGPAGNWLLVSATCGPAGQAVAASPPPSSPRRGATVTGRLLVRR